MRRTPTAHELPDASAISEAIRPAEDVAAAGRAPQAPSPAVRGSDDLPPRPMTPQSARLRDCLTALPAEPLDAGLRRGPELLGLEPVRVDTALTFIPEVIQ
jgi:hypothetical protein